MTHQDQQSRVANYLGAYAHLLSGRPGRQKEFIDKVQIMLCGAPPHALQLMQFSEGVRVTGRPVLWIHHSPEVPQVPQIGLVAHGGDQVYFVENCMLWMAPKDDRASLIPDSFQMGAFRFDENLQLQHSPKTPARSFKVAERAMARAYRELYAIAAEQERRGEGFELPHLAKAA